jgi:hypothetical protein
VFGIDLSRLNTELKTFYGNRHVHDRCELSMKVISDKVDKFPSLQGPGIKGATIKSMVPLVAQLAHHLDDGTVLKHRRSVMVAGLRDFYNVLQEADDFVDEQQLQILDTSVYDRLANYTFLAHHAMQHGQIRYNVIQKHHMMAHLPGFARASMNPRLVAAYTEESFVGQGSAE